MVTAVIAAIEAIATAALGMALIGVPALLLWTITFGLAAEPNQVLAGVSAVWSLAHLVPIELTITPEMALGFGLPREALTVGLSLAPLGLTLISALFGARSGWRLASRGGIGVAGLLGGLLGFGVAALVIVGTAGDLVPWPLSGAVAAAAAVYTVPATVAFLVRSARDEHPWWERVVRSAQRAIENLNVAGSAALPSRLGAALRLAAGAVAALVALSALLLTVSLFGGYGEIIALTQHLQLDPLGSFLLFLAQLALLPVALAWGASWLTGAGFAVGAGSSVTPFESLLGPLPALPLFGALPQGWGGWGGIAPALVMLAGITVAVLLGRRPELQRSSWAVGLLIPLGAAVLAGLIVAGASALASGAIGPDRLAVAGPRPWLAGGLAAAELGVGMLLGTVAIRIDRARLRAALPDAIPEAVSRIRERIPSKPTPLSDQATVPLDDFISREEVRDWREENPTAEVDPAPEAYPTVDLDPDPATDLSFTTNPGADQAEEPTAEYETDVISVTGALVEPKKDLGSDSETTIDDSEATIDDSQISSGDSEHEPASETAALRAYAWDETDPEEAAPERTGWRWPRSGR